MPAPNEEQTEGPELSRPPAPAGEAHRMAAHTPHPVVLPNWFTPMRLLTIFCFTNLFVYLDRGLISSNGVNGAPRTQSQPVGSGIQGDFDLSYFQDGLLPAAFLIGLLVSSPIFAEVCKTYSAFRLLGIGMAVWTAACFLCGLAPNFAILMIARMFVGVGEASFVALAAPFIDDYAPPHKKATWFAAFFLCIPVGFAVGYIVGGLVAPALGWRAAFILEGAVMVPFVIFALTAQPLHLRGTNDEAQIEQALKDQRSSAPVTATTPTTTSHKPKSKFRSYVRHFWKDAGTVASQKVWVLACVAYTLYVAVLGVYAYWGPKAGHALFFGVDSPGQEADLVFGGVTVLTGVVGTIAGGILLDKLGDSLYTANMICGVSTLAGVIILLPAFLATKTFESFMATFAVGQLLIFMLQAPVVAVQMWCVPQSLRALGTSLMTMCIHLFGDVPSPPLLGLLQTRLSDGLEPEEAAQKWRISLSLVSLLLVLSGMFFMAAARASGPTADYRETGRDDKAPLLDEEDVSDTSSRGNSTSASPSPAPVLLPQEAGPGNV